jgi:hypothetical protein
VIKRKATPLDRQLITAITNKLKGHLLRVKHGNVTMSKDVAAGSCLNDEGPSQVNVERRELKTTRAAPESSDSDDDIFENAGDYVPPKTLAEEVTKANANDTTAESNYEKKEATTDNETNEEETTKKKKKKSSIFDNLITKPNLAATTSVQPRKKVQILQLSHQQQQIQSKNLINRDVIGVATEPSDDQLITKRRGPQTAAMEGYSMSNYSGGYGEDMDVDFGNYFDNEEDDNRRKNRKKDKTDDDDYDNVKKNEEDEGNGF